MATLHGFSTWEEVTNYIESTLDIHYTDNPTGWVDAMKEEMAGQKFIKIINDVTGETTTQAVNENIYAGVGEMHVGENYQGQTVSGGGVKSAPTAKSIITQNSGGGTAVITDEATGVKDTGLINGVKGINVLSGLLQLYGLVHTGIQIANAQVWKDMSNYVYDSDFTEDTPIERVIDFLGTKLVNTITDITSDGDVRVSIPETIARRLYTFLSNHMIQEQTPGIYPNFEIFDVLYNYIQRTLPTANPAYTLERYRSVTNPMDYTSVLALDITDDLFKAQVSDFIEQCIGSGFLISSSVATALLASMDGLMAYLKEQSVDACDAATLLSSTIELYRGSTPPSKDTPVSLSEFSMKFTLMDDNLYTPITDPSGDVSYELDQYSKPQDPPLESGYSYQYGDCVKYLKRGKTGDSPNDYGYRIRPLPDGPADNRKGWYVIVEYPSNERHLTYYGGDQYAISPVAFTNGYSTGSAGTPQDFKADISDVGMACGYSNLGYVGVGSSYQPDDYLVTAGFRSKNDSSGNSERHPDPTKTMEEQYPEMNFKQNATPKAVTDPISGETTVQNNINNYVSTTVPFGGENADRLIQHGLNNSDDPDSYVDDRSQSDKIEGKANTKDPVDGYNEDTNNAVDEFNKTRNDPNHYPEPIPQNEPNPQYPTNPPSIPDGENDDPTDPTVLPGVTASGMVSVYNPTKAEVISFSSWLWSGNVFENIKKLMQDPMEAIIGMHIMYATPHTTTPSNIIVGWLDSGVAAKVVDKQYTQLNCGSVFIPEYYGDARDYEPYVQIHLYLPFVGIVSLKPNDVIGKSVNVTYGIDALTGTCLAMVTTTKGNSKIQCYTFPGNCAVQIPLTGGNYAQILRGVVSMAVGVAGSVATGNPIGAVGGILTGAMSAHVDVAHSGTLGANAGAMGVKKPYVIITRKVAYDAVGYNQFYGYPANKTVTLGACYGYTRVKSVHIESIPTATSDEKQQIEALLKQGVIIRQI